MEEITAGEAAKTTGDGDEEAPALKPGEVAKSMVCEDCGKKFRSMAQAEAHAERTCEVPMPTRTIHLLIINALQ